MEPNSPSDEEFQDALSEISPYNGKKSEQIDKPESEKGLVSSTIETEKSEEGEEEDESYDSSESDESDESNESNEIESSQDDSESYSKKEPSWPNLEAPLPLEPPSEKHSSLSPLTSTDPSVCPGVIQEADLKLKTTLFAWSTQNLIKVSSTSEEEQRNARVSRPGAGPGASQNCRTCCMGDEIQS